MDQKQIDFETIEVLIKAITAIKSGKKITEVTEDTQVPMPTIDIYPSSPGMLALGFSELLRGCLISAENTQVIIKKYDNVIRFEQPFTVGELVTFLRQNIRVEGSTLYIG